MLHVHSLLYISSVFISTESSLSVMRAIANVLPPQRKHWVGDGFLVTPVLGKKAFTNDISPFLMFDYGSPRVVEPSNGPQQGVWELIPVVLWD